MHYVTLGMPFEDDTSLDVESNDQLHFKIDYISSNVSDEQPTFEDVQSFGSLVMCTLVLGNGDKLAS